MPFKRNAKSKRKHAKRKFLRLDAPVPKTKLVKLRYCDTIELDPGATDAAVEHRFRANSVYDPDRTGTGHQPMYFDQLAAIYESYEVVGSRITVRWNTTAGAVAMVGVNRDNDTTTTYNNRSALMENPNSKFKVLPSNGSRPLTLSCNWSARKTFGPNYNRDDNEALVTANPVNESDFVIWAINTYGTQDPGALQGMITIDYIVKFMERKEIAQS